MGYPEALSDKKSAAYVWFANAVASEDPSTKDHDKRLILAKAMATLSPPFDQYVYVDLMSQGHTEKSDLTDVQNRISAIASNLVALGFGG